MQYTDTTFLKKYPLSRPKKLIKKMVWIVSIYLAACLTLFYIEQRAYPFPIFDFFKTNNIELIILLCIFTALLAAYYIYQVHYIKKYFYNITEKFLIIRKGIFAPQEITVPLNRIQDVYFDQDILDRLLDIYDIHISTATITSGRRAHIDGVDKKNAEKLREHILNKLQH